MCKIHKKLTWLHWRPICNEFYYFSTWVTLIWLILKQQHCIKTYSTMAKKIIYILFAILCIAVGLYPSVYFLTDTKFGLLETKTIEVLSSTLWNASFYIHISFGGLALLIGWTQFSTKLRKKYVDLHWQIGKLYIASVFLSSLAGIYLAILLQVDWFLQAALFP